VVVAHFTFETNGRHTGLLRRTETDTTLTIERMDQDGNWIDDPTLFRHFWWGNIDLVPIEELEARRLAESYGGRLGSQGRGSLTRGVVERDF